MEQLDDPMSELERAVLELGRDEGGRERLLAAFVAAGREVAALRSAVRSTRCCGVDRHLQGGAFTGEEEVAVRRALRL